MSHTAKVIAEILSRIQVQGSCTTIHYGSRSSYPIGTLYEIISNTQNISRRSLMKIFNVSQLVFVFVFVIIIIIIIIIMFGKGG
jgi:lipopolysaccharide/colanic/teichoic acid biosynthesis glycosyltransferase